MEATNSSSYSSSEIPLSRKVRFWLMLISEVPSLSCSLFILYHFITDSALRRSINHHTVVVLNITVLIFNSIDVPLYLNFTRTGKVLPATPAHCLIWWVVDLGVYYTCSMLGAWNSIERHILVFYSSWVATSKRRFFVHYLPLAFIIMYAISYYTWVIFFPPCENTYDYSLPVCSAVPCYLNDPILSRWEITFHGCILTLIIIFFSIGLLVRVILQKRVYNRTIQWRRMRHMTFQLLTVSSVFTVFNLPIAVMYMAHMLGLPTDVGVGLELYFFYITYWLLFSLPFVCLNSVPNLRQKLRKLFRFAPRRQTKVAVVLPMQFPLMTIKS